MLTKSTSSLRKLGNWFFWNPCFKIDGRDIYLAIWALVMPINFVDTILYKYSGDQE